MSQGLMTADEMARLRALNRVRTTRRSDAEAGVNLSKRRAWYAEEEPPLGEGDEIPDWIKDPVKARAEIKRVRDEAASQRTKRTEAERKLTQLQQAEPEKKPADKPADKKADKTPEPPDLKPDVDRLTTELKQLQSDLQAERMNTLRMKIATEAGLPAELAARLHGTTEAELKADAEKLKPFAPAPQPNEPPQVGRRSSTTSAPGGQAAGETDAQKRSRIFNR